MKIYKYRKFHVAIIICLLLVGTLSACSFGKGFGIRTSSSKSEEKNVISMRFDVFKDDMIKVIDLKNIEEEITFYYSDFKLKKGSFVLQLLQDQELISEKKISSGDSSSGSVTYKELNNNNNNNNEYSIKIFAVDAIKGRIKIKW